MNVVTNVFDNEPAANECRDKLQAQFLELLGSELVFPPKGVAPGTHGIAQSTGIALKVFLGTMGVQNVGHYTQKMEVHTADLAKPVAPIIHLA